MYVVVKIFKFGPEKQTDRHHHHTASMTRSGGKTPISTGSSSDTQFVLQEPTKASGWGGCVMAMACGRVYRTAWRPSSSSHCGHP